MNREAVARSAAAVASREEPHPVSVDPQEWRISVSNTREIHLSVVTAYTLLDETTYS